MHSRRENATGHMPAIAVIVLILVVGAWSAAGLSHNGSGRVQVGSAAREAGSHISACHTPTLDGGGRIAHASSRDIRPTLGCHHRQPQPGRG